MAKIVFRLRNVPDDEADDIRQLLDKENVEYYETSAGRWGIGLPAIWLEDENHFDRIRGLIDQYQVQRQQNLRSDYEERKRRGDVETLMQRCKRHPLRVGAVIVFTLLIIYISISPFVRLAVS